MKIIFGSISYASTPVIYSYILEGADEDWSSGTENIVVLPEASIWKIYFQTENRKTKYGLERTH